MNYDEFLRIVQADQTPPRRKVFISHSHLHQTENEAFVEAFESVFVAKALGVSDDDEFIESTDTEYVMQRIRDLYVADSTVTIVLIGSCTHSRRYVDWEIKASLQQGQDAQPNGLIGITLPSTNGSAHLPERFRANWNQGGGNCYAMYQSYPRNAAELREWIEEAYRRRTTRAHLITNLTEMWSNNRRCLICGITH